MAFLVFQGRDWPWPLWASRHAPSLLTCHCCGRVEPARHHCKSGTRLDITQLVGAFPAVSPWVLENCWKELITFRDYQLQNSGILHFPHFKTWERGTKFWSWNWKTCQLLKSLVFIFGKIFIFGKYKKGKDIILLARVDYCYQFGAYPFHLFSINIFSVLFTEHHKNLPKSKLFLHIIFMVVLCSITVGLTNPLLLAI